MERSINTVKTDSRSCHSTPEEEVGQNNTIPFTDESCEFCKALVMCCYVQCGSSWRRLLILWFKQAWSEMPFFIFQSFVKSSCYYTCLKYQLRSNRWCSLVTHIIFSQNHKALVWLRQTGRAAKVSETCFTALFKNCVKHILSYLNIMGRWASFRAIVSSIVLLLSDKQSH